MMKGGQSDSLVLLLPATLAVLIAGVSLVGILTPGFYATETLNWQVQSIGQDIVDLVLIAPILLVTTLISIKTRETGVPLVSGVFIYIIYTFVIYCFDVHFNILFVLYCAILGLAFFSFLYFIYKQLQDQRPRKIESAVVRKLIGIYFIVIAVLFYVLWLSDLIPSILSNSTPAVIVEAGLPTNPVHVIDLSIFLPGIFMTGILLMKNHTLGLLLTPAMLVFFILMNLTIGVLSFMMEQKGLNGSLALTITMGILALLSFVLLTWYMKNLSIKADISMLPELY